MQLSQRVRARDVEDFMSSVGKVRDVKLIVCKDLESVPLALGLSGKQSVTICASLRICRD